MQLPALRFPYGPDEQLTGSRAMAALMGCPRHLLWLCDRQGTEDLKIHRLVPYSLLGVETSATQQFESLQALIAGPLFDPPALVVINVNEQGAGEQLLHHLLCLVAVRRIETKDPRLDFSYCGTTDLDLAQRYSMKPRHVVAWGPVSGLATGHRHQQAIEFTLAWSHHTRILVTAADDLDEMLDRLRLDPTRLHLFNLGSKHVRREKTKREVKKKIGATREGAAAKRKREGVTIG